ncbi:hypothetical protein [Metabacillus arenae]|uniref:Uncharacterized protein n=1 Tax=Metabacillus arenae TaxID=2771434 RepID=A0A926NSA2_9BACI|nr:hypothetical protein [Metabacillus arenae]MBD1382971.1 hypothetical protein [Metabacillus arenae]
MYQGFGLYVFTRLCMFLYIVDLSTFSASKEAWQLHQPEDKRLFCHRFSYFLMIPSTVAVSDKEAVEHLVTNEGFTRHYWFSPWEQLMETTIWLQTV